MKRRRRSNRNSSKKRQKNDFVDRITDLPDPILGLILSHLPTKEAVATSILSKRWHFGWVTIRNLDFCCDAYNDEAENQKFIQVVNRIFLLHDTDIIDKFCLEWRPGCVSSQVDSWITTVIKKHVKELSLCLAFRRLRVSVSGFICVSLQSLKLDGSIFVPAATVFCLPKLARLQLVNVAFESEESFEKLVNGCSVLDDLCIHTQPGYDYERGNFTYRICSTSLTRLTYFCISNLKLEASSIEYLNVNGGVGGISLPENLPSLVEARIKFDNKLEPEVFSEIDDFNSIVELLRVANCVKILALSHYVMESLRCATISLSTEFRSLVKLETATDCCPWSSLREIIQNSDNLEDFTVFQFDSYHVEYTSHDDQHSEWTIPVEVPRCFSNSLKRVHIDGYKGMEEEHGMILYMLEHGSVLQVMKVSCDRKFNVGETSELLKKIHESPKKSSACKVEIIVSDKPMIEEVY